ncbi:nicotinate phosphoribosyltransferase [Phocaeicola barnesiae]|jgi:nicotinate phosphoribosyltransferase|uniref:Nicotinate phosphoribosyltransferase n=1 Tax=Phocaeicola barnesiae TaxID=376804 RepID=A0AAW5MY87_9BACT|nr:nicotinate phosphoribosyltransferase [Phocaeicola barnesiae]MBS6470114.1 nicotinate phosphoribosyltransferase [Bacteroides sp.]CDD32495.1 nicotinate phosphoribosyltransferase [Bacteroides sp. CAG:714]MCF2576638.1 nicotinate phosphoribosyltransferase [Phocaeicola barnesiae]MCF2599504.1 nicotinate phosphoribosyltransferase [Phocaeicola barnesiae]MCR8873027.1 nicotinate phosphoribosyltransferase [Phocaeicola barnesiae]
MVIKTILDTDLYKFTTSYAYIKLFPYAMGTFTFIDRDDTEYTEGFLEALKSEIHNLSMVQLTSEELEYMASHCRFLPRVYWEWLSSFRFDPDKIEVGLDEHRHLQMRVTDYLYKVTLYEVPLLAIVSEIRNQFLNRIPDKETLLLRLADKVKLSNDHQMPFSEFGTRRRFSFDVQKLVVAYLKENARYCTGTSNCYLAMKYDMRPMGTHPHEWFMFHGAQFGYKHANYMALENWVNVYDGDLGTALSDTYTSDSFLSNFSRKQAKLFDGVRCDSGDEIEFIDRLIDRYKELGIDPTTKTIIFSNALDFGKALQIFEYCKGKIRCSFGIGTNLTNDTGFPPANIVMKLSRCKMNVNQEWRECVKLSDDMGKHVGSTTEVGACLHELRLSIPDE